MRVVVEPRAAEIRPGQPQPITVTITNTSTVIGGYTVRVLGADPGWVSLDAEQISLFPDESRTLVATVTAPRGIPAGPRRVAIQVRELTPPEASSITEVDLSVPASRSMQLRVDPLAVTAGRRAAFSVVVENTGNTTISGYLAGDDAEGKVTFGFQPEAVSLAPGEHAVVDLRATARRHVLGAPTVRMLGLYLDEPPPDAFFSGADPARTPTRDEREALANATFIQRSVLSRGPISLIGLLAAVTVFAIVITIALSRLVGQSAADRNLALQVAAARNGSGGTGTSAVSGTVRLLTSGKPVPAVSVSVFDAADTSTAVATTATDANGAYAVGNLGAGKYKISFRGAGFVQLWYPGSATDADATTVTLKAAQQQAGLDVTLGGVPATISGTVAGDDVSAATLYLRTVPGTTPVQPASALSDPVTPTGPGTGGTGSGAAPPPDNGGAIVQTVPIGSNGTFSLAGVPSPSVYDLVVTKVGYATSTQRIDIGAGEQRTGVQLNLAKGDGLISGTINSSSGALGGVTITATAGQSTATTVSLTDGAVGAFTLRSLPTPATFTVVATKAGFASQTLTLTLGAGQKLTGVAITLGQSAGTLTGLVTLLPGSNPAAGVAVTVTNGVLTVQTGTQSAGQVGHWQAGGLPVPGTYTVTFSRSDLASQTVSVSLDAAGNITPGSQGATITASGITVGMQSSTAVVAGTISQHTTALPTSPSNPVGEATVQLSSGASTFTVTTASVPAGSVGQYRIESVPPGTWTVSVSQAGTSPTSTIITLSAGQVYTYSPALAAPASISGTVVGSDSHPRAGWTVQVYVASQYPNVVAYTTTTDGSGAFSFPQVNAPEAYIIVVRPTAGSAQAASRTIQVDASEQVGAAGDQYSPLTITADPS